MEIHKAAEVASETLRDDIYKPDETGLFIVSCWTVT
jgi:hypothetical protein